MLPASRPGRLLVATALAIATAAAGAAGADEPIVDVFVDGDAPPTAERADPTPAAYALGAEELGIPGLSAAEALARVPGVQPTRRGGNADLATVSVRGSASAQTPIYLAGVKLNDEISGTVDLSTVPLGMLRRIEVYRGNAPLYADDLGIGGAILLEPTLPSTSSGEAALGIGSFGEKSGRIAIAFGDGRSGAALSIATMSGDGDYSYIDDGGTRFFTGDDVERRRANADYSLVDVWTIGRWHSSASDIALVLSGYQRGGGAPGLLLRGAEDTRADTRRLLGGLHATFGAEYSPWAVVLDAGALVSRYRLHDPEHELGAATEVENAGERASERVRVRFAPVPELALWAGVAHALSSLSVDADGAALERAHRRLIRPELAAQYQPLPGWHLAAVAALEDHLTSALADDAGELQPALRLGTRWRFIDAASLIANVSRSVRVPTLGELYGVSAGVVGNSELGAERALSADAGANFELALDHASVYAQLVGFARFADDLIAYRRSSFGIVRPYNVARARILGLELAAGASFWRIASASVAITAMDPRDTSDAQATDNDIIPLHARLTVVPRLQVTSPPLRAILLDRASLGATLSYRSSRAADPAGLIVLEEQAELGFDAGLAFGERIAVDVALENALDVQSFDVVGYPLPGRSFHASAEVRW